MDTANNQMRWIMYKNSALLAIGAALVFSLFFTDAGLADQNDKKQDACILMAREMKGTANLSSKHISYAPKPCGGRTGASCRKDSPAGSGAMATDGSRYTITTSESAAGLLFGASYILLVGIGARRLRIHHARALRLSAFGPPLSRTSRLSRLRFTDKCL